jgi:hypothetical protein
MAKGFKTGGREQGTPNRLTKELRSLMKNIIYDELEHLPERLDKLDDKDRLELVFKFSKLVFPPPEPVNPYAGEYFASDI